MSRWRSRPAPTTFDFYFALWTTYCYSLRVALNRLGSASRHFQYLYSRTVLVGRPLLSPSYVPVARGCVVIISFGSLIVGSIYTFAIRVRLRVRRLTPCDAKPRINDIWKVE